MRETTGITEARWEAAIDHARTHLGYYREIGPAGMFGGVLIAHAITRYENGERTPELLEELESIE